MSTLQCAVCRLPLRPEREYGVVVHTCQWCGGLAATVPLLSRIVPRARLSDLWKLINDAPHLPGRACPACSGDMRRVQVERPHELVLDGCRTCQVLWFDKWELRRWAPDRGPARATSQDGGRLLDGGMDVRGPGDYSDLLGGDVSTARGIAAMRHLQRLLGEEGTPGRSLFPYLVGAVVVILDCLLRSLGRPGIVLGEPDPGPDGAI